MAIDYDYETGNGWNEYQKLILHEMRRVADQGEKNTDRLHVIDIRLAGIDQRHEEWAVVAAQREAQIATLQADLRIIKEEQISALQADLIAIKNSRHTQRAFLRSTKRIVFASLAVLAWVVATGVSAYGAIHG